jgi:hypothetical protein
MGLSGLFERWKAKAKEVSMTLAVAAEYAICVANLALIRLSSLAHVLAVARTGTCQLRRRTPSVETGFSRRMGVR